MSSAREDTDKRLVYSLTPLQTQVSGMSNNAMLRDLRPDTEYKVTLVPIYPDVEGKRMSENGKTSESHLAGHKLQIIRS